MNSVGASVAAGYHHSQPNNENNVGQTKHWTQSRTVRAVAGIAVLALGGLAGLAVSYFASPFAAIVVAGAVAVVLGVGLIGYFYHHSKSCTATLSDAQTPASIQQPPVSSFLGSQSVQPPPYTPYYEPPAPPPYSPYAADSVPAKIATPRAPAVSLNTAPSDPPPAYTPFATPSSDVTAPADLPPKYTDSLVEKFISGQESRADRMLQPYALDLYKSCRNGNCYFDSVINQCPAGSNWTIKNLRRRVYQVARQWCTDYAPNYDPSIHSSENDLYGRLMFQNGLKALKKDKEWVDATDSVFTAKVLNTPIVVLNINGGVAHAFDAEGRFMNDVINTSRDLGYYRTVLNDRFILLIFDTNHFMGVRRISQEAVRD